jgi:hypothetical protein
MITCPTCGTKHHNLKLARGQTKQCTGLKADNTACCQTLTHRHAVFDTKKYDKLSFIPAKHTPKPKFHVLHAGRSKSAPPQVSWPFQGMSKAVTYVANTKTDATWAAPANTDILLPFKALNVTSLAQQGLIISLPALSSTPSARSHFDAITVAMTTPKKGQDVTEAVGEAAAAIIVMAKYPAYRLLWGFDVHSGAGIDQIWSDMDPSNPRYLVVEAKGPTASLSSGALGNPVGYEQMEKLWVIDRLGRMLSGTGGTLATNILGHLALDVVVAIKNHGGSSKNFYGCVATPNKTAVGTLSGLTVTAQWQSDGMLSGKIKNHTYTFP